MDKVEFGGAREIDRAFSSLLEWAQFIWQEAHEHVPTSHMLLVQWDSGLAEPKHVAR
jgi:hypothetical protein